MSIEQTDALLEQITTLVPACDFKGVKFCDISPLLADPIALQSACHTLAERARSFCADAVAGLEARGFIFGPLVAQELGVGFVQLRKPGKLPGATLSQSYQKEYGTDTIEVQTSAIQAGQRILIVDDILATGGTLVAACKLIEAAGGTPVGCALIAELAGLGGRDLIHAQTDVIGVVALVQIRL